MNHSSFSSLAIRFCTVAFAALMAGLSCPAADEAATLPRPDALTTAISEIHASQLAEAQARLVEFLKADPKNAYAPEAHYLLGQALAAAGKYAEAKDELDQAVETAPGRTLKALAMLGRADCNMGLKEYHRASRQYHWLETMYRDVRAVPQDEVMYKLGLACKLAEAPESADYWFKQVIELYATGKFAADAKREHRAYNPADPSVEPRVYSLEVKTYSQLATAEAEAEALRVKAYRDVEVVHTTRLGNPVYEVHIGKFVNENDALRAQTDAELAGLSCRIRPALFEPMK